MRENDPKLRQMLKTIGLGVLYGASAAKVASVAGCPLAEAEKIVGVVKKMMKPVTQLWKSLKSCLIAAKTDGYLQLDHPSGNCLYYRNVRSGGGRNIVADIVKHGRALPVRLWFGSVTENLASSLARDIFINRVLEVEKHGYEVLLHVHDEVVIEVDEDRAQQCLDDVIKILSTPPDWINTIALSAEGKIMDFYAK